jgi:hypothetical protein
MIIGSAWGLRRLVSRDARATITINPVTLLATPCIIRLITAALFDLRTTTERIRQTKL